MSKFTELSAMKPFRCDLLGTDGNLVRTVPLFAVDGDTAKEEATKLLDWLSPHRAGGLILWEGPTVLLRVAGAR
jgi:hypothetical protein